MFSSKTGVVPGTYSAPVATNSLNSNSAQMLQSFPLSSTVITNERNSAASTNRIIVVGNSLTPNTDTSINKTSYIVSAPSIVSSVNPNTRFQHNNQPVNPTVGSSFAASLTTTTAPVSTDDISRPVSANRGINHQTTSQVPAPAPQTAGGFSQESEINEVRICIIEQAFIFKTFI